MHTVRFKHVKRTVEMDFAGKSRSVVGGWLFPPVKRLEHRGHLGLLSVVLQAVRLNTGQIVDFELLP